MFLGYMPGMGTHGLLRLFSPPSIKRTLRFLSRAASRPATTHPQEPPPATIMSTSSGIVMMTDDVQRCLGKGTMGGLVLVGCLEKNCKSGKQHDIWCSPTWRSPTFGRMDLRRDEHLASCISSGRPREASSAWNWIGISHFTAVHGNNVGSRSGGVLCVKAERVRIWQEACKCCKASMVSKTPTQARLQHAGQIQRSIIGGLGKSVIHWPMRRSLALVVEAS